MMSTKSAPASAAEALRSRTQDQRLQRSHGGTDRDADDGRADCQAGDDVVIDRADVR